MHHGAFELHYYGHHYGLDPNIRDRWADHQHYDACVEFCERYDQNCFDPADDSEPLETFAPMVPAYARSRGTCLTTTSDSYKRLKQ